MEEAEGLSAEQLAHDDTQAEGLPRYRELHNAVMIEPGEVPKGLKFMIAEAVSMATGDPYCAAHNAENAVEVGGLDTEKVEALASFRSSPLFTGAERAALELAHAVGSSPASVSDAHFEALKKHFSEDAIVEIVSVLALLGWLNCWCMTFATEIEDRGARLRAQASCPVGLDAGRARKKMSGRRCMQFGRCLICFGAAFMSATTLAQTYPTKPVRYVIPMSPGSGADVIGHIVAIGLAPALGQQVVVDNRTGAAGNIGAELVAKAPPDGYTVFQGSMTHTTNVSLYTNLTYDLVRDFAPVTLLATSPASLVVHPSLPVNTVADLVAFAKARPGQLNYASTGLGTATFLAAEMFKERAGIDLLHVPYRGGGESLASVVMGETSVYFGPLPAMMSLIKQARLRALAVTTAKRVSAAPELPTIAESGYPGYETGNCTASGAGEDAEGDDRDSPQRSTRRTQESAGREPHERARLRCHRQHAGTVRRAHQKRSSEAREDSRASEGHAAVIRGS